MVNPRTVGQANPKRQRQWRTRSHQTTIGLEPVPKIQRQGQGQGQGREKMWQQVQVQVQAQEQAQAQVQVLVLVQMPERVPMTQRSSSTQQTLLPQSRP